MYFICIAELKAKKEGTANYNTIFIKKNEKFTAI